MLNTLGRRDGGRVEDQQVRQTHLLGKINYRGGYRIQFSHYMETAPSSFKHNISKWFNKKTVRIVPLLNDPSVWHIDLYSSLCPVLLFQLTHGHPSTRRLEQISLEQPNILHQPSSCSLVTHPQKNGIYLWNSGRGGGNRIIWKSPNIEIWTPELGSLKGWDEAGCLPQFWFPITKPCSWNKTY